MNKSFKKWSVVCFVSVILVFCFHHFISKKIAFVTYSNGYFRIQDYAYHIILVKAFWSDGFGNIYDLYFQQQALSAHVGSQINTVMPLGITPLALVVWFPFTYVARFSMALSYTFWVVFSIGVLFTALYKIGRYVFLKKKLQALPITLSLITIFSSIMFRTLYLGQTSVLAAGLFVHLIFICYKPANLPKSAFNLLIPLLIFVLGMKPTYIALGLGLLIINGLWQEAFYSVAFVTVVLIGVTPLLTVKWVSSYINLLRMYSQGDITYVYDWAIKPHTMNIFRSAFRNFIGDNIAVLISNVVTYGVYIGIMGFSFLTQIRGKQTDQLIPLIVTKGQLFVLLVASYLLFTPYAGVYEDLLFLPIFVMVLLVGNSPPLTSYKNLALVFFLFVILLHNYFPPNKPLWLFWTLKAMILGYMFYFCRFKERTECTNWRINCT